MPILALISLVLTVFSSAVKAQPLTLDSGNYSIKQAFAVDVQSQKEIEGAVKEKQLVYDLQPLHHYNLVMKTTDDKIVHLLDTSWYMPGKPATGQVADEDKTAINDIVTKIDAFTNHNSILSINGNADRAVAVVELYRDSDFHARKGDEIIWRIELWYFEFQAGGWAKVQQQNRVIERVRFTSKEEFEARRKNTIFLTRAEGIAVEKGKETKIALKN